MKIMTEYFTTNDNEYKYKVITATTNEGIAIAYELVVNEENLYSGNGFKYPAYSITDECIADFGIEEILSLREYHEDGTVHIYGN